jgi:hypothetical protein
MLNWDRLFSEYFCFPLLLYSLCTPVLHIHISFIFHRRYTVCSRRIWQLRSTKQFTLAAAVDNLFLFYLMHYDSHVVPAYWLLRVTHFKRIFCRLGISHLVIGNRTDDLYVHKPAANILNKQLCTTDNGWSFLLAVRRCWKFSHFKRKTLQCLTGCCTLCSTKSSGLKFSKSWTGSHVTYSCHHNSSSFILSLFVHSWRFSVFHSL